PAARRTTPTRSGSRSTPTTRASCSARRWTTGRAANPHSDPRGDVVPLTRARQRRSGGDRNREADLGPLADDARDGDRAAVRLDQVLRDREAETRATRLG